MKRRFIVLCAAALLFTGCATRPAADSERNAEAPVSLEVWVPEDLCDRIESRAADFAMEGMEVSVTVNSEARSTMRDTVLTDPSAAADVLLLDDAAVKDLTEAGALYQEGEGVMLYELPGVDEPLKLAVNAETAHPEAARQLAQHLSAAE